MEFDLRSTRKSVDNTNIILHNLYRFRENPAYVKCVFCGDEVVTRLEYKTGTLNKILCGVLCLIGCWFGCCLIPFFMDEFKDVEHFCPNCNKLLGTHKKFGN